MTQRQTSQASLFATISDGIASQEQSARLQKLEIGLGFLGFWTLVSLAYTVTATVGGRPAVAEALVSALFVWLTWRVYRTWQRAGRTVLADAARRGRRIGG